MQSNSNLEQFILDSPSKIAYQSFQEGKKIFSFLHKQISTHLTNIIVLAKKNKTQPLSPQILDKLQQRLKQLEEIDWQDAQKGVYPISLLFDNPWSDFFRYYPEVWFDLPKIWERLKNQEYQKFASDIECQGYPAYYLQNFHYQTDGYLSDLSANLYDLQVEILFNGTADAMRRRILATLKQGLNTFNHLQTQQLKVLDIACGTGRTLRMIRGALPKVSLFGTDLSPAYLRKANQLLSEIPGELPQLFQANAENLPYLENYFHGVTSVFLFHELPEKARQRILEEAFRVLKPEGVLVICDSMQVMDSSDFQIMMDNFPAIYHEPYYKNYINDNLSARLEKAGFTNIKIENHFVSKYWTARKPK